MRLFNAYNILDLSRLLSDIHCNPERSAKSQPKRSRAINPKPLERTILIRCLKVMRQSNEAKTVLLYDDKSDPFWITYPQITCCSKQAGTKFWSP